MPTIAELGSPKRNFDPQGNAFLRIVQNWGNELIQNFRINLLKNNSVASKSLYQDITPKITPKANGANLKIQMLDYWQFVENGRKAGKMPPVAPLIEYVKNKKELQMKIANARDRDWETD